MKYLTLLLCFLSLFCVAQTGGAPKNIAILKWLPPVERENGAAMTAAEIGGYEIQYKLKTATTFQRVVLPGSTLTTYNLELPASGEYDIKLAVYDSKGIYSVAVPITYNTAAPAPKLKEFNATPVFVDPEVNCKIDVSCKIIK